MIQLGARGSKNLTTNAAQVSPEELRKIARGETSARARDRRRAQLALKHMGYTHKGPGEQPD